MQCQDGHISTCLIKTLVNYLCCAYFALCQLFICYRYSLPVFIYLCSLFIIDIILFCSLFDFSSTLLFDFVLLRSFCFSSFFVYCSKEKSSILILDCVPGILLLRTTSFMQVDKHHTADCTDFVLV